MWTERVLVHRNALYCLNLTNSSIKCSKSISGVIFDSDWQPPRSYSNTAETESLRWFNQRLQTTFSVSWQTTWICPYRSMLTLVVMIWRLNFIFAYPWLRYCPNWIIIVWTITVLNFKCLSCAVPPLPLKRFLGIYPVCPCIKTGLLFLHSWE